MMTLIELESKMSHLWAKSSSKPEEPAKSLFRHTLDVTRQMAEFYRLYMPKWPLPGDSACLPRMLAYAALVHDFGKIHAGFQAALRPNGKRFNNRHEILSLAFLSYLDIPCEEKPWVESAVALHHKNLFFLTAAGQPFYYKGELFGADVSMAHHLASGVSPTDVGLLSELLSHASEVFAETGWPSFPLYPLRPGSSIDLIGSMRNALERVDQLAKRFEACSDEWGNVISVPWPDRRAGVQVRGFIVNSDHLASFEPHPLRVGLERVSDVKEALSNKISHFNFHQRQCAEHEGSGILVAPTGAGKTEAGLLWSAKQAEACGLRGRTFVLLPYQASMNAMQGRLIENFAPAVGNDPAGWDGEVALIHGRSVRTAYERLLERDYSPADAARYAHLQNDLARLNVAPIRVCSPFQVIRLLFATKGVEGLILSLTQSRLIFDEIHAYDPEVAALALTSARFITSHFGSRVLFMTATLPTHLRRAIEANFDGITLIKPDKELLSRPARHRLRLLACDSLSDSALKEIRQSAQSNSVLVVVNQVSRAIQLYKSLSDLGPARRLLHSRFTYEDRFRCEQGIKPAPGKVLISTQAVEVSLDVDYDVCFSELAPLESLLQRFGRCNRYGLRPAATVAIFSQFPPTSSSPWLPYDEDHLRQTQATLDSFLKRVPSGLLDEKRVTEMLDDSYPAHLRTGLERAITSKCEKLKRVLADSLVPFGARDPGHAEWLEEQWERLFDGHEVLPEALITEASRETGWLGRARYLVPVSGRALYALKTQGRVRWDEDLMCEIARVPYSEYGLELISAGERRQPTD